MKDIDFSSFARIPLYFGFSSVQGSVLRHMEARDPVEVRYVAYRTKEILVFTCNPRAPKRWDEVQNAIVRSLRADINKEITFVFSFVQMKLL